jgi:hypothetical protein
MGVPYPHARVEHHDDPIFSGLVGEAAFLGLGIIEAVFLSPFPYDCNTLLQGVAYL